MIQSGPMISSHKRATIVLKLVKLQLIMGLIATVVLLIYKQNINTALSGLVGMLLAVIPSIIYAKIAFGYKLVVEPGVAFARHKKAMVGRFILNLVLFAIVLYFYKNCNYIALFVTYFISLAGYWVSLVKA